MELFRALGSLIEVPAPEHRRVAAALRLPPVPAPAVHGTVVRFQRHPYASVYLGPTGMMGGDVQDRVVGFRRALGLPAPGQGDFGGEPKDGATPGAGVDGAGVAVEPDHLASLLGLLAGLDRWCREESSEARSVLLNQARVTLVWEYLASWRGPYLVSFEDCGAPYYEAWAALLGRALDALEDATEFPSALPAALQAAPALPDPRLDNGDDFVQALLAPVRSGMILLRDDLVRLSRELGLACRAGERRYVLAAFFAQDPAGTLAWLARHAGEWSTRVAGKGPGRIAAWWSARAAVSASLLSQLTADVQISAVASAKATR